MIYIKLFLSFLQIGLFSIGGGYAAIPLVQSLIVERQGWITMTEFANLITIAEMTPGPIAVNSATFVGIRIAGIFGAIAATGGCIFPSCIIVSALAYVYRRYRGGSAMGSILGSLRPAVVALIAGAGLSMLLSAGFFEIDGVKMIRWGSLFLFATAFVVLRKWKMNPILVMWLCGGVSLAARVIGHL